MKKEKKTQREHELASHKKRREKLKKQGKKQLNLFVEEVVIKTLKQIKEYNNLKNLSEALELFIKNNS